MNEGCVLWLWLSCISRFYYAPVSRPAREWHCILSRAFGFEMGEVWWYEIG